MTTETLDRPAPQGGPTPPDATVLELHKLDKRFTGTHALKHVDLAFRRGEIHAIVGENGAGKSTLIKLLTGVILKSGGEILWEGRPVAFSGPQDALALGINAVHQEVVLCPHLTVAANLFLGDEHASAGLLHKRRMEREAQTVLDDLGFRLPSHVVLGTLTIGQQQLVATARAALRGTKFLIFDEPTAYLTRQETAQLFALIFRLKARGITLVYISHRLEEVFELSDRVTVLRDGALIATHETAATSEPELIRDMSARSIEQIYHKEEVPIGDELLRVDALSGPGFQDVSLSVRRGEIVGLYGLIGAGRSEFVQTLFGRHRRSAGTVHLRGKAVTIDSPASAIAQRIALVPESRRDQGLCLNLPVSTNLNLTIYRRLTQLFVINPKSAARAADKQIGDLRIKTASRGTLAQSLSGGNQQKIVVGKWLAHGADLYIFDEPTVGVDVGTKVEIYRLFAALLRQGAGIILISSYLPEVFELADRLHVFRRGRDVAQYAYRQASAETILTQAIGV